jgi:hypothetical protein
MKVPNVSFSLKNELRQDNIFPDTKVIPMEEFNPYGYKGASGNNYVIVSNEKVVSCISHKDRFLDNVDFFAKIEENLINADIDYKLRTINKNDCSFRMDVILNDPKYVVNLKTNQDDTIKPMMSFINSYDGTAKTSGFFGYLRQVCINGLNLSNLEISFSKKKKIGIKEEITFDINETIKSFMDNENFTIVQKIETLDNVKVSDLNELIKNICDETKVFRYEKSDKNPDPSLNADIVKNVIESEAKEFGKAVTYWDVYNGFNAILTKKFEKPINDEIKLDQKVFNTLLEMA